jgi:hypothetical protein
MCQCWALAHTNGTPRPFIVPMVALTRRGLINRLEQDVCPQGWRKWSRKSGAKIIRVRIEQGAWP